MKQVFRLERGEAEQIIISVIAIAFAFSIVVVGAGAIVQFPKQFIAFTALSVLTIGVGFILHEMAHKLVAIHYGAYARFQMWVRGLLLMIGVSFLGFLFAAPGAVYIYAAHITRKENGLISLAGPLTNVLIAVVFLMLSIFVPAYISFSSIDRPLNIWEFGAYINLILAIFNMLPLFPLDGSKVFIWNKIAWGGFMLLCFVLGIVLLPLSIIVNYILLIIISLILSGFFSFRRW